MNRKTKIIALLFFTSLSAWAQQSSNDTLIAKVFYKKYHMYDTIEKKVLDENMILYIGKHSSLFKSLDKMYNDSLIKDNGPKMQSLDFRTNGIRAASYSQFVKVYNEPEKVSIYEFFLKDYLITDNIEGALNWEISSDTGLIGNLSVTKATCFFRGRNYVAWFCPDIPIQNGPWKFGGLPGLILEIADNKGQVRFSFTGFQDVREQVALMPNTPSRAILITHKQLLMVAEAFRNDPVAFTNNALSETGSSINLISISGLPNNKVPKRTNNPIELEEY